MIDFYLKEIIENVCDLDNDALVKVALRNIARCSLKALQEMKRGK